MFVSAARMLNDAAAHGYAIGQFNVNNLEWIRAVLDAGQRTESPIILGVTEAASNYMGGLRAVRDMTAGMLAHMRITVPVALHLDHATEELCLEAIGAGFSSVMFDGSKMPFAKNLEICQKLAAICVPRGISLEAELGSPAGEEDGISGSGSKALPDECAALAGSGITVLAASIGNMHGEYPANWPGLDLGLLEKIRQAVRGLPLALHGGSGVPCPMVKEAIGLGICKINVNTELQMAFAQAAEGYFAAGLQKQPKGFNLQKLMAPGIAAITAKTMEKIRFFGPERKFRPGAFA